MIDLLRMRSVGRRSLVQQVLLWRLVLWLFFAVVALWVGQSQLPIILVLMLLYALTSLTMMVAYWTRVLGSADLVYFGLLDTSLFLGAGVYLTGGAFSPVLYVCLGLPASYLVLSSPRAFVAATVVCGAAITVAVVMVEADITFGGLTQASSVESPLPYVVAVLGALAILGGVGWRHSVVFARRRRASQQLQALLDASESLGGQRTHHDRLAAVLEALVDTLSVTDESYIYVYDIERRVLRQEVSLGPYSWFGQFPQFRPGQGNVGRAFQTRGPVASNSRVQLLQYLEGVRRADHEASSRPLPSRTVAVPLLWGDEAVGVLLLAWQDATRSLIDSEMNLVGAFARYVAGVVGRLMSNKLAEQQADELSSLRRYRDLLKNSEGIEEFVLGLRGVIPFDCVRVRVARGAVVQEHLSYFWCADSLDLGTDAIDLFLDGALRSTELQRQRQGQDQDVLNTIGGVLATPPILARDGIGSVVGLSFQANNDHQSPLVGAILFLHRESETYIPVHSELLKDVAPYLSALVALSAMSAELNRKSIQTNAFERITSLAASTGSHDTLIRGIIDSIAGGWKDPGLSTVFVLWLNGSSRRLSVTVMDRDHISESQHQIEDVDADEIESLSHQLQEPTPQPLAGDLPLVGKLKSLIGKDTASDVFGCPLYFMGKVSGMLGVGVVPGRGLGEEVKLNMQSVADAAPFLFRDFVPENRQVSDAWDFENDEGLRRAFLHMSTHEFRTPLASIKTSFELLNESTEVQTLGVPYQRLLTNIGRSISALELLTNDLSEVVNLSAGKTTLDQVSVRPEEILRPVVEMILPLSHMKDQSLEVEMSPGLPFVRVDERRIEQVLTNILSNSIKYTPKGREILVKVSQEDRFVKFAVSDTGRGIEPKHLERVFEPFFRASHEVGDASPGSGLGLALAKTMVELHGGRIWAESQGDTGSTFCFTIPIDPNGYQVGTP